jgi:hypothetical protein
VHAALPAAGYARRLGSGDVLGQERGEQLLVGLVGLIEPVLSPLVVQDAPTIDDGGRGLSQRQGVVAIGMAPLGSRPRSENSVDLDSSSITSGRSSSCDHTAPKAHNAAVRVLAI